MSAPRVIVGVDFARGPSRHVDVIGKWDPERKRLTIVTPPDPVGTMRITCKETP